jgi:hypothetical protein
MKPRAKKAAKILAFTGLGLFGIAQLVPYGRNHSNPPVVLEPGWDRHSTRELAVRACFDCHSNETRWPWYSHVAPMSWLVQRDVDVDRRAVNFSEWNRPYDEADESPEAVLEGDMPLVFYLPLHPSARLSPDEKHTLADGLRATLGEQGAELDHD